MNSIRRTWAIALLGVAAPAIAGEVLVEAVETAPYNIVLPATSNGMMTFQPCAEQCDKDHERVQLTVNSRFSLDGKKIQFEDFRREFLTLSRSEDGYALVRYDTRTKQLVELIVTR